MKCEHLKHNGCMHPTIRMTVMGRPTSETCRTCPGYSGPSRGLGDTIHNIAKATGVERLVRTFVGRAKPQSRGGCGCQKRRESLNDAVPFAEKG